jgi:hypothetical protein
VKCREALEKDVSPVAKVKAFLSATTCKTAAPNIIKPTIIEDYYNTFNAVDSLDTNVGNIPWLVTRYSTRVLIGLVQMTLVSSHIMWMLVPLCTETTLPPTLHDL